MCPANLQNCEERKKCKIEHNYKGKYGGGFVKPATAPNGWRRKAKKALYI